MSLLKNKWSPQEDSKLELILKEKNGNKWSAIARELNQMFEGSTKNGKQCRDRFINYLQYKNQKIGSEEWTFKEWTIFVEKYFELGPKWTQVAKCMPGNPENRIKNKFYGLIRKSLKLLNEAVRVVNKKQIKPIKYESLARILRYGPLDWEEQPEILQQCGQLQKDILAVGLQEEGLQESADAVSVVERIHTFNLKIRCVIMRNSKPKQKKNKNKWSSTLTDAHMTNEDSKSFDKSSGDFKWQQSSPQPELERLSQERENMDAQDSIWRAMIDQFQLPRIEPTRESAASSNLQEELCMILQEEYVPDLSPLYF